MKKLTIAIPTYKRNKELIRCLDSISFEEEESHLIEIVISDNDPQNTLIPQFKEDFYDFTFNRNNENLGIMGNMNKLLQLSKGEFIFFITDDDYFLPGSISKIFRYIQNLNKDINAFKVGLITHLIKSKKVWENNYKINETSSFNTNQKHILESSHIFSGCCIKKESIPLEDFKLNYNKFYYTTSLLFGYNFFNLDYYDELLIMHTWENKVHWDFANPESPELTENWNDMCDYLNNFKKNSIFNELKKNALLDEKIEGSFFIKMINYFLNKLNLHINKIN